MCAICCLRAIPHHSHRLHCGCGFVSVLFDSFHPRLWFFELISIFQKLLITGVVPILFEGTRLQLWFGLLASGGFGFTYLLLRPYRMWVCNALNLGVTVTGLDPATFDK